MEESLSGQYVPVGSFYLISSFPFNHNMLLLLCVCRKELNVMACIRPIILKSSMDPPRIDTSTLFSNSFCNGLHPKRIAEREAEHTFLFDIPLSAD